MRDLRTAPKAIFAGLIPVLVGVVVLAGAAGPGPVGPGPVDAPADAPVDGAESAPRCTKSVGWGPVVAVESLFLLGEATGDSVAGPIPAALRPRLVQDDGGELPDQVFGQVVRLRGAAPRHPESPAAQLEGATEVIMVWWGYDAACRPGIWRQSVLHASPGDEHLLQGALRDEAEWVNGVPTVDVHAPWQVPFPGTLQMRVERGGWEMLSPSQLFSLISALPVTDDGLHAGWALRAGAPQLPAIWEWLAEYPELAGHYPVAEWLAGDG